MGNVDKEPLLSDILFTMDMERQHEAVSAMLDGLQEGDLESSLANIDVSLFLGKEDSHIPYYIKEEGSYSCDSDELKHIFHPIKSEPDSPKKHENETKNHDENLFEENSFVIREIIKKEENSEEILHTNDNESKDYTFYIAPAKKKRAKKRQHPEYCKKRKHKPDKEIKIVIKRKEKPNQKSNSPIDTPYSDFSVIANSPDKSIAPESVLDYPFCDIPFLNSFSTSIAEKVKTRRRSKNSPSESSVVNSLSESSFEERLLKKNRKIRNSDEKHHRSKKKISEHLFSVHHLNEDGIDANQNIISLNNHVVMEKSSQNQEDYECMPHLSLVPRGLTDNFINKNNLSMMNCKRNANNYRKLFDFPKRLSKDITKLSKETGQYMPKLIPVKSKTMSVKCGSNRSYSHDSNQRTSKSINFISTAQESIDVPVSVAEVEISSSDEVIAIHAEAKAPYTVKSKKLPNSSFSLPVVLLTPISNKQLSSESLQTHLLSDENENSYSSDPSSSYFINKPNLVSSFRSTKGPLSGFDSKSPSNSNGPSSCDTFDQHLKKSVNQNDHSYPDAKSRLKFLSKSAKLETHFMNNSVSPLRRSTRSNVKSPEKVSPQNKSKFSQETDQRFVVTKLYTNGY